MDANGVLSQIYDEDRRALRISPDGLSNYYMASPNGWGSNWRAALAEADTRLVRVKALGDSITKGHSAGNYADSYFNRLITDLQTTYGDGGTGLVTANHAPEFSLAGYTARLGSTGTWVTGAYGYGSAALASVGVGDKITLANARGRNIDIYYEKFVTSGDFDVKVNDVVVDTVDSSAAAAYGVYHYDVPVGTVDGYTVDFVNKTAGGSVFYAIDCYNDTGVTGHNMACGGNTAAAEIAHAQYTGEASGFGGFLLESLVQADLVICSFGVNDYGSSIAAATFGTSLLTVLHGTRIVAGWSYPDFVMVTFSHSEAEESAEGSDYYLHVREQAAAANTFGAAYLNLYSKWPWKDADKVTLGYYTATDYVHPDAEGHAAIYSYLAPLILAS